MASAFDYREMARECMKEAEATKDAGRRMTLESIAKLYVQTAFSMEASGRGSPQQLDALTPPQAPTGEWAPAGGTLQNRP